MKVSIRNKQEIARLGFEWKIQYQESIDGRNPVIELYNNETWSYFSGVNYQEEISAFLLGFSTALILESRK